MTKKSKQSTEIVQTDSTSLIQIEKEEVKTVQKTEQKKAVDKKNDGNIEIKGKTDSTKDFHFANVVEGDTLADIYISGTADFIIKNRWNNAQKNEFIESTTTHLNKVAKIARKAVAQTTIKEVAEEIKDVNRTNKTTGFTFPIYLIIGGSIFLIIILVFLYYKFGGIFRIEKSKEL